MKARRLLIAPVLLLVVALACTDRTPTSVPAAPAPDASLIGGLLGAAGLLKCSSLPYASQTRTIGPMGDTISARPRTRRVHPRSRTALRGGDFHCRTLRRKGDSRRGAAAARRRAASSQRVGPGARPL